MSLQDLPILMRAPQTDMKDMSCRAKKTIHNLLSADIETDRGT